MTKRFGGLVAVREFSAAVEDRALVAIAGPNGAGKTTLFNICTGQIKADSGSVLVRGQRVNRMAADRIARQGVARTFQELRVFRSMTTLENLLVAFPRPGGGLLSALSMRRRREDQGNTWRALELLEWAGLEGRAKTRASELSFGQQKMLAIVSAIATGASLLFLDEPVAGVEPAGASRIREFVRALSSRGVTVVMIEHDLETIASADKVILMDEGELAAEGSWVELVRDPRVVSAYLG